MNELETNEELLAALHLLHVSGVGPVTYRRLIRVFGSPQAVLAAPRERLLEVPDVGSGLAEGIARASSDPWAGEELERAAERGVRLIGLKDPAYPKPLLNTYDPPPVLYVQGQFQETDALAIAIVGSRQCTPYGRRQAQRLTADLVGAGFTIVSGLARGIDTVAHSSALGIGGGRTLAVLGNGLGSVYPPENRALHDRILAGNGAVFSELPLDTPPASEHFPRRNRIIAGLSLGVVVVEGRESSGALITARYAVDMDREVFAVPGPVDSLSARGPHRLIKKGAKLVEDVEDILEELKEIAAPLVRLREPDERLRLAGPAGRGARSGGASEVEAPLPLFVEAQAGETQEGGGGGPDSPADGRPTLSDLRARGLNPRESQIYQVLDPSQAYGIDHIILRTGLKPQEVLSTLLVLEVRRLCRQLPGKRFIREG